MSGAFDEPQDEFGIAVRPQPVSVTAGVGRVSFQNAIMDEVESVPPFEGMVVVSD